MNLWTAQFSAETAGFIVNNKLIESHKLAFKRPRDYGFPAKPNIEKLAKSISAIANADGGILIVGIQPSRGRASALDLLKIDTVAIDSLLFQLEMLISPKIDGLLVEKAVFDEGEAIMFKIPNDGNAPFMSPDKRFYKRVELKEILLEEYEIRRMYRLNKHAEIELFGVMNTQGIPLLEGGKYVKVNFYPKFLVKNVSEVIERDYKVELYIPSALHNPNFSVLQNYFNRLEDQYNVFQAVGQDPLFQDELSAVMEANIFVNADNYEIFAEDEIIIKLFYSQGVKIKCFKLIDLFLYQNARLSKTDFVENHILSK